MAVTAGKSAPRYVTVPADCADRRLDNFVMGELRGLPRARVYRLIRRGEVRVNKGRSRPGYRLAAGDVVRLPPVTGLAGDPAPAPPAERVRWIEKSVVYEDDCLLVLDKPAGLAVHGGSGVSLGAIELLRAARPAEPNLELVHRLDRETSGCLLVARKRSSLRRLHAQLRAGTVDKHYTALLLGAWAGGGRDVDRPLRVDRRQGGERHVEVAPDGKPARTHFEPVERFANAVLCDVRLYTGRTHQIRVHAAALGHPVAGDARYGDGAGLPAGLQRLFLHAAALEFEHPGTGRHERVTAPLPGELHAVLERLRRGDD